MVNTEKPTVLLVEDNHMNKVLVREILTLNGYEVVEANSGVEAIKYLVNGRANLILMDLHLPEMDGFTATRIIKADVKNRAIPVLALTASAMKGDEEMILSRGFDGYIAKPIDTRTLLKVVKERIAPGKDTAGGG